jgi:hypothetical protein
VETEIPIVIMHLMRYSTMSHQLLLKGQRLNPELGILRSGCLLYLLPSSLLSRLGLETEWPKHVRREVVYLGIHFALAARQRSLK